MTIQGMYNDSSTLAPGNTNPLLITRGPRHHPQDVTPASSAVGVDASTITLGANESSNPNV
jgi:hypothetical protein